MERELDVAFSLVEDIMTSSLLAYTIILKKLREAIKLGGVSEEILTMKPGQAKDLILAIISMELQLIERSYSQDEARKIEDFVIAATEELMSDYPDSKKEILEYREVFRNGVKVHNPPVYAWLAHIKSGQQDDAIAAVPARLLRRWLGSDIEKFDTMGMISPLLLDVTMEILWDLASKWRGAIGIFKSIQ